MAKLLITQTEYQAHSSLPGMTSDHENVNINNTTCVYCNITDQGAFDQLKSSLDSDSYATSDGSILIPKVLL